MNLVSYLVLNFVVLLVVGPISVSFTKYLYLAAGVTPSQVQTAYFPNGRRGLVLWLEDRAGYSRQFRTMLRPKGWRPPGRCLPWWPLCCGCSTCRSTSGWWRWWPGC